MNIGWEDTVVFIIIIIHTFTHLEDTDDAGVSLWIPHRHQSYHDLRQKPRKHFVRRATAILSTHTLSVVSNVICVLLNFHTS